MYVFIAERILVHMKSVCHASGIRCLSVTIYTVRINPFQLLSPPHPPQYPQIILKSLIMLVHLFW